MVEEVDGVVDGKSLQNEGGEDGCFRLPLPTSSIHDDDDICPNIMSASVYFDLVMLYNTC